MGFFDTFSETVASTGRALGSKTKVVAESTKLSFQITQEEAKLKTAFAALGEAFYKNNLDDMPEEYAALVADIKASKEKLAALTEDKETVSNKKRCAKCGAWMPKEDTFCGKCGTVNEVAEETEAEDDDIAFDDDDVFEAPEEKANTNEKICPNCKTVVKLELLYCPECGEKL